MLKIKDYPQPDRERLELAICKALCNYCHIPFLLEIERQRALVMVADGRIHFIHEECLNARFN